MSLTMVIKQMVPQIQELREAIILKKAEIAKQKAVSPFSDILERLEEHLGISLIIFRHASNTILICDEFHEFANKMPESSDKRSQIGTTEFLYSYTECKRLYTLYRAKMKLLGVLYVEIPAAGTAKSIKELQQMELARQKIVADVSQMSKDFWKISSS